MLLHSDGIGVSQDDYEAMKWAGVAVEQGLPEAQYHLGFFLGCKTPSKVSRDAVSACMWYRLEAAGGNEEGHGVLKRLESQLTPAQLSDVSKRVEEWNHADPTNSRRQLTPSN